MTLRSALVIMGEIVNTKNPGLLILSASSASSTSSAVVFFCFVVPTWHRYRSRICALPFQSFNERLTMKDRDRMPGATDAKLERAKDQALGKHDDNPGVADHVG